jgi:hypothetical protein
MKPNANKTNKTRAVAIDKNMKDYSRHPFFIKKTEEANAFIRKYGLPKDALKK